MPLSLVRLPPHGELLRFTYAASRSPFGPAGEGVTIYRRSKPASFELAMRSLSQAWHLGGLRPPHQYLSGAALSPPRASSAATPQRLIACLNRRRRYGFRHSLIP